MPASPCFKIGGWHSDSDSGAGVEAKIRCKGLAYPAKRRIVDREVHPLECHVGISLAASQRFPPLPESEVVQNFDQAEPCREAQNQPTILLYQLRKRGC